jgi:hypothetical protein
MLSTALLAGCSTLEVTTGPVEYGPPAPPPPVRVARAAPRAKPLCKPLELSQQRKVALFRQFAAMRENGAELAQADPSSLPCRPRSR